MRDSFPSLFSLACSKDAWMENVCDFYIPREGGWRPFFSRPLNNWELSNGKCGVNREEEDRVC